MPIVVRVAVQDDEVVAGAMDHQMGGIIPRIPSPTENTPPFPPATG